MFCCTLPNVRTCFAIILIEKRELVALPSLASWCLVMVVWLFLAVLWVCLQFLICISRSNSLTIFCHFLIQCPGSGLVLDCINL